ncbi:MAG: hypothetical protein KJ955_05310 [Nanoarchaeota archaeon]|nr:hypothetical protein [Nanoarchaeota archaeon]
MKKLFIIFVCIFFLFALIAFAQNETIADAQNATGTPAQNGTTGNVSAPRANTSTAAPPAPRTAQPAVTPNCNSNGVQDPGETCLTCPPDVRCKSGEMCTEAGECVKQANFTIYIIVGIGIFALLALFFVAKRLTKKPEEPLKKPEFMQQKPAAQPMPLQKAEPAKQEPAAQPMPAQQSQQPMQKPAQPAVQMPPERSEGGQRRDSLLPTQKPESAATVGNAATLMGKPSAKQEPEQEKSESDEPDEHKGETQIQAFIRQRREMGWADEQIRQKMKETGWKDTQIALEFLKAPKFMKKQ